MIRRYLFTERTTRFERLLDYMLAVIIGLLGAALFAHWLAS